MGDVRERLDDMTRRTAVEARSTASPFEACQRMRAKKVCPGYVFYPETGTEAFSCSRHCSCWMRIRESMLERVDR